MKPELREKIETICNNINEIKTCIEYSNYPLMEDYLKLFMANYSSVLIDIIGECKGSEDKQFYTKITTEILDSVKSQDVFRIMDKVCYELNIKLLALLENEKNSICKSELTENSENNNCVKMYVMTHKAFNKPKGDMYIPLHVGSVLGNDFGYLRDDSGDNISDLNPYFGELTGFYWLWKNVEDLDIIGTCHYRRYFGDNGRFLNEDDCHNLLSDADIICSNIVATTKSTYKDDYADAHNIHDLELVGKAIESLYPNDYKTFVDVLNRNDHTYGNLLIMRKSTFDEYCEWLFNIFMWMIDKVDFSNYDDYHKRLFGFLSENLVRVFAEPRGYIVKPGHIYVSDEKAETKELKQVVFVLIKERNIDKAKELLLSYTKSRPDVLLPLSDISGELSILIEIVHFIETSNAESIEELYKYCDSLKNLTDYYRRMKQN